MLDVFLAESNMPDDKKFCLPNNEETHGKLLSKNALPMDSLKKIYEAQGDIAGSLRYLAFEMDAYREQLKQEKIKSKFSKEWWCIKRAWDNRSERFMLYLNKFSTNYGNNWHRGFWVTIAVMSFCFFIYCLTLGFWFGSSWSTFFNLASYAPQYLNPFRDGDSIIPTEILPTLNDSEKIDSSLSRYTIPTLPSRHPPSKPSENYGNVKGSRKIGDFESSDRVASGSRG